VTERSWAWAIWVIGFLVIVFLAIPSLGFTLIFLWPWWVGGPFYVNNECEIGPYWRPMKPEKLWWRDIR
jgi:hypothetical protein